MNTRITIYKNTYNITMDVILKIDEDIKIGMNNGCLLAKDIEVVVVILTQENTVVQTFF